PVHYPPDPAVDWRSTTVDRWSAAIDRHWPPLTGGPVVTPVMAGKPRVTAGKPRGTTHVVTRGTTNDWYEGARRVSVRGCRVEIQGNNEAVVGEQKDYNTLRSAICVVDDLKGTKIPLPLEAIKTSDQ
ncbi:hypothetical protein Tco_1395625, partial [Tanacetum coccineum]